MSIRVMSLVWDRFEGDGNAMLLLLAMADYATDDGGRVYPSAATMARKIRSTDRSVRRHLKALIDAGWIEVVRRGGASGKLMDTTEYRINVEKLEAAESVVRRPDVRKPLPPDSSVTPDAAVTRPPDSGVTPPLTAVSPDTSEQPSEEPPTRRRRALGLLSDGTDPLVGTILDCPEFRAAWTEWWEYRRAKKHGNWADQTYRQKISELVAAGVDLAVFSIRFSMGNSWQGLIVQRRLPAGQRLVKPVDANEQNWSDLGWKPR